jgi:hypothetical protein
MADYKCPATVREKAAEKWRTILRGEENKELCAFCEYFDDCDPCPLTHIGQGCGDDDSVWDKWSAHSMEHDDSCCVECIKKYGEDYCSKYPCPDEYHKDTLEQMSGECCRPYAQAVLDAIESIEVTNE